MARDVRYFTFDDVLRTLHRLGIGPIRDYGLLDSSLYRPQTVVFGAESYPDLFEKAAALLQSLARNRALFDGNKRLAWTAATVFLVMNGFEVQGDEDGNLEFMLACARGDLELEQITDWLREHSQPVA